MQVCKAHCAGGAFYSLQFGRECWCGLAPDIEYDVNGPSAACDHECSGDPDQICGGYDAFEAYSLEGTKTDGLNVLFTAAAGTYLTVQHSHVPPGG